MDRCPSRRCPARSAAAGGQPGRRLLVLRPDRLRQPEELLGWDQWRSRQGEQRQSRQAPDRHWLGVLETDRGPEAVARESPALRAATP
ncbi:MAG: hypothetical protein MZV64_10230 [Ignavibacteriales bacterium]|nr:hypothetical protein [Ignavibacteriales bacterium]